MSLAATARAPWKKGYVYLEGAGTEPRHLRLMRATEKDPLADHADGQVRCQARPSCSGVRRDRKPSRIAMKLWVGNNLLQILNVSEGITEAAVMAELADLEMMLNEALLDFEDRRRDIFDDNERRREQLLSEELDRLLALELDVAATAQTTATHQSILRGGAAASIDLIVLDERARGAIWNCLIRN
jgi:hypothetical protein